MRNLIVVTLIASAAAMADDALELVDTVDLERYQGTWYEIARLPNRFQDRCAGRQGFDVSNLQRTGHDGDG